MVHKVGTALALFKEFLKAIENGEYSKYTQVKTGLKPLDPDKYRRDGVFHKLLQQDNLLKYIRLRDLLMQLKDLVSKDNARILLIQTSTDADNEATKKLKELEALLSEGLNIDKLSQDKIDNLSITEELIKTTVVKLHEIRDKTPSLAVEENSVDPSLKPFYEQFPDIVSTLPLEVQSQLTKLKELNNSPLKELNNSPEGLGLKILIDLIKSARIKILESQKLTKDTGILDLIEKEEKELEKLEDALSSSLAKLDGTKISTAEANALIESTCISLCQITSRFIDEETLPTTFKETWKDFLKQPFLNTVITAELLATLEKRAADLKPRLETLIGLINEANATLDTLKTTNMSEENKAHIDKSIQSMTQQLTLLTKMQSQLGSTTVKNLESLGRIVNAEELFSSARDKLKDIIESHITIPTQAPHVKSWGEKFLNALSRFFTWCKRVIKGNENQVYDSRSPMELLKDKLGKLGLTDSLPSATTTTMTSKHKPPKSQFFPNSPGSDQTSNPEGNQPSSSTQISSNIANTKT